MWTMSLFQGLLPMGKMALAASPGEVVINEIAWAGSADSGTDEWIELYNPTGSAVDLTGWTIEDDAGASVYALSGTIGAGGFYVIEDSEAAVQPDVADLIVNLSLANSGDSLVLKDDVGAVIDTVNGSGGAWFAGDSATFTSMERIDALTSGDDAGNWANGSGGGGKTASGGAVIVGTPGQVNSVSNPLIGMPMVSMNVSNPTPEVGEQLTVSVDVTDAVDLFSYGFEVDYDPVILSFVSANADSFLSEAGSVATTFQSGLEDGSPGTLLVAEARTIDPKVGTSGSGKLLTMTFDVLAGEGQTTDIVFASESFLADTNGAVSASFADGQISIQQTSVDPVMNVSAIEGAARYTIQLSWDPVVGAESYNVYRKDAHGNWVLIGSPTSALFLDADGVTNGGDIVPFVQYEYQVTAVSGVNESGPAFVNGMETRGLTGDNDRSDRVDGVDLDRLARHFAETDADAGFEALVDTTYDGMIDGNDLIDLGANFALTYQS